MKKPSDFTKRMFGSLFRNTESEIVFANCMKILAQTGDQWRDLSWEEYKERRLQDGLFSEAEKRYFEKVVFYTKSPELAQEVEDGVEGYEKRYKHNLEKIFFYRLKGYDSGFLFKDMDALPKVIAHLKEIYKKHKIEKEVEEQHSLIELSILKYNPDWTFYSRWGEGEWALAKDSYYFECSALHYKQFGEKNDPRLKFKPVSLFTLACIQEKEFVEVELSSDSYTHYQLA